MSDKCKCECLLPWLSGFFAFPAVAHLIRIIAKWDVALNGEPITMKTSWIVIVVSGLLSMIFGMIACKRHKKGEAESSNCCC